MRLTGMYHYKGESDDYRHFTNTDSFLFVRWMIRYSGHQNVSNSWIEDIAKFLGHTDFRSRGEIIKALADREFMHFDPELTN